MLINYDPTCSSFLPQDSVCPLAFLMSRVESCLLRPLPRVQRGERKILNKALSWKCSDLAKFFFKFSKPHLSLIPLCLCVSCFLLISLLHPAWLFFLPLCQGLSYSQVEWSLPFFFTYLSSYYNAVRIIGFPPRSTKLGASWGYKSCLIPLCIYCPLLARA